MNSAGLGLDADSGPCYLHDHDIVQSGVSPVLFLGTRAGGFATGPTEIELPRALGLVLSQPDRWVGRLISLKLKDSPAPYADATPEERFKVRADTGNVGFSFQTQRLHVPYRMQERVAGCPAGGKWGEVLHYSPVFVGRGRYFEIWAEGFFDKISTDFTAHRTIQTDGSDSHRTKSVAHAEAYHCFIEIAPANRPPLRPTITHEDLEATDLTLLDAIRSLEPLVSEMRHGIESLGTGRTEIRTLQESVDDLAAELRSDPPRRAAIARLVVWVLKNVALAVALNLVAAAVWEGYGEQLTEILRLLKG